MHLLTSDSTRTKPLGVLLLLLTRPSRPHNVRGTGARGVLETTGDESTTAPGCDACAYQATTQHFVSFYLQFTGTSLSTDPVV